jgi:hypothetical protein
VACPGPGRRARPAANAVDGRQRARRLEAGSERAALRESRAVLAGRDKGERVVAAELTVDQLAKRDYFPMLEGLATAGRRSERGVDDDRDRYRLHVKPRLGELRLGDVEPRHVAELIAAMRARRPKPYAEATIDNVVAVVRALCSVVSGGDKGRSARLDVPERT